MADRFCECRDWANGGHQLVGAGECDLGEYAQVCANCLHPHVMYFEMLWKDCHECGATVTSPWEEICVWCFKREPYSLDPAYARPYHDWDWARARDAEYLQKIFAPGLDPVV